MLGLHVLCIEIPEIDLLSVQFFKIVTGDTAEKEWTHLG